MTVRRLNRAGGTLVRGVFKSSRRPRRGGPAWVRGWRGRSRRRRRTGARAGIAAERLEQRLQLAVDLWPTASITVVPAADGQPGDTIRWAVAFTEPVTGVDASDFRLVAGSGVATTATQLSVSGSGDAYVVTANRLLGVGTLGLNLVDDGSIRDATGNLLQPTSSSAWFASALQFTVGNAPHPREGLKAADVTGDGILDLVVANTSSKTITILQGSGNGSFTNRPAIAISGSVGAVETADLDGDGDVDLVVASPDQDVVRVLLNRGDGSFSTATSYATRDQPYSLRVADFDSDGVVDIAAATWGGGVLESVSLMRGVGNGSFQTRIDLVPGKVLDSLLVGDFTGDGRPDVVVSDYSASSLTLFAHAGGGSFLAPATVTIGAGTPSVMAAGDIDGDGNLDVATIERSTAAISVLLGNGDGTFQPRKAVPTGVQAGALELRDVTSDGRLDLVVTLPGTNRLAVLVGRGDGSFAPPQQFTVPASPGSVAVGDFNRDGRPDIAVAAGTTAGSVSVFLNTAKGGVTGAVASVSVTVPPAPVNLVVTRGDKQVSLAWDAPASNGGTALTGYIVQTSEDGGATWKSTPRTLADGRQLTVTGLANGASYLFRVAAVNAAGTGTYTAPSEAVKPVGYASAPLNVAGTAGDGRVDLTWGLPATTGGEITNYVVEYRTASGTGSGSWTAFVRPASIARSAAVTGLVNGRDYLFRVAAINSLGQGEYATTTTPLVPQTTPGSVTGLAAVAGNGVIDVSWAALPAAATGGSPVTGYVVEYKASAASSWTQLAPVAAAATTVRVTGLANGTSYVYRVAATNAVGTGGFTAGPAAATPFQPASAPSITSATAGTGQVTISWSLPVSDGGSEITDYSLQYRLASAQAWTTVSLAASTDRSATVAGLVNGTPYVFRVAAVSAAGTGDWSAASAAAAPFGVPTMTGVAAGAGDGRVSLSWSPASANGSPVTNYLVEYRTNLSDANAWIPVVRPATTEAWILVSGLVNGLNHQFRVAAVNAAGTGPWSVSAIVLPDVVPAAPSGVVATARNGGATLAWTAPTPNGGTSISTYMIQYRAGDSTQWTTFGRTTNATPAATVTGLVNGLGYVFRVAAVNQRGTGSYSDESAAVIPAASAAPTVVGVTLRGTPAFGASQVSWDVTFSEPVTGVNVADFAAVTGGLTKVGSLAVSGSGSAYVVTASGITGAGTVGLNLLDDGSIRNAASVRLSKAGTTAFQQTNVTMGALPMSLVAADVNADGRPDLITTNDGNRTVSVRLALSNGSYQSAATITVGTNPRGVIVADVNLDGRLDIVVVNRGSNTVSVLRGSGSGSFSAQPQVAAGSAPSAVVVADLNLDGVPDLVVTNPMSGAVSILAGMAGGGFQSRRTVTTGGTPNSLAVGDVNLDGRPDIVVADANGSTVGVLIGNGNLSFQAPQQVAAGSRPDGVRLADLDGDGRLDIVVVNTQSGTVSVLKGNGNGLFQSRVSYAVDANPASITVADIDGDTRPDLVVTNPFAGAASVLIADGAGGFLAKQALTSGGFPAAAAAADFNADGRTDLAVVDAFLPGVKLFTNTLSGATTGDVAALAPLPGAPTLASATGGNGRAVLSWTAGSDGGVPITNYVIQRRSGGGDWAEVTRPVSTATTATVTGLTNGTTYEFRVAAVTTIGRGSFSTASSATPAPVVPEYVIPQSAVPGNGQATVSWHAPADDGGSAIIDYVVQYKSGSTDWTTFVREPSTARSAVVTGLTNGATYVFRFAAVNAVGTGEFSAPGGIVTPIGPPGALSAAPSGTGGPTNVSLLWSAPANDNGSPVSSYIVQYSTDDGATWTTFSHAPSTATSVVVTGLVNGTNYRFRVAAVNAAGTGEFTTASDPIAPRLLAPSAPRYVFVYPGNQQIRLDWTPPESDGGSAILDYEIQYSTGLGIEWTTVVRDPSAAQTFTLTGLTNGVIVIFRLAAVNAVGVGAFTGVTSGHTPATAPQPPEGVAAIGGNGTATVTWMAPSSNGGAAISDYTVQYSVDGTSWTTFPRSPSAVTTATVTGLVNGTSYVFRVAAVNPQGASGFSEASSAVTPAPVPPGGPRSVVATAAEGGATVTWLAPMSDGGSNVTDYRVEYSSDSGQSWTTFTRPASTALTATVTGLDSDLRYTFRVAAVNAVGAGEFAVTTGAAIAPAAGVNPRVLGITLASPVSAGATSVTWNVTFSKPVTGVTASQFQLAKDGSITNSPTLAVSGTGTSYTVTVSGISGSGTIGLNLRDFGSVIRDAGGRALTTSGTALSTTMSGLATFNSSIPTAVQVADLNGDGWLDIGMRYDTNWRITVRLATGPGTFGPETTVSEWWSSTLEFADVNGDGRQDMLLQYRTRVALGNGDGTFAAPQTLGQTYRSGLEDINGDGIKDIVGPGSDGMQVWLGTSDGGFLQPQTVAIGSWTNNTIVDANRDGRLDIVASHSSGVDVIINNGNGTYQSAIPLLSGWNHSGLALERTDFDGDGWQDLAIFNSAYNSVVVFAGGQGEGLSLRQAISLGNNSWPTTFLIADLTGDGRPDVTVGNRILVGRGDGTFMSSQAILADTNPGVVWDSKSHVIADFNADGRLDLLAGGFYTGAGLYLNVTGQQFTGERALLVSVPGKPGPITVTPGNTNATLSWTAPSTGSVTNYRIEYSTDGGATWTYVVRSASTATTAVVSGLVNGREYVFRVAAVTSGGWWGSFSELSAACIPVTLPDAPWLDSWIGSGHGAFAIAPDAVLLRWHPGTSNGGSQVTNYLVQMTSDNGESWATVERPASSLPFVKIQRQFTAGATYGFRVAAINGVGMSAYVTMNSVQFSAPTAAPTNVEASARGSGEVTLYWSSPGAVPGNPPTSSIVEYTLNGTTWIRYTGSFTGWFDGYAGLSGLAPGSYRFRVAHVNASGTSPFSQPSVSSWPQGNWLPVS